MSVNDKIKALLSLSGVKGVDLAAALGVSYNSASTKVYRGIKSVNDLIKVVEACGASLTITTKDGVQIPLTVADIEEQTKTKE